MLARGFGHSYFLPRARSPSNPGLFQTLSPGSSAASMGLEAELRFRFDQLDRLEDGQNSLAVSIAELDAFIRGRLNGGSAR